MTTIYNPNAPKIDPARRAELQAQQEARGFKSLPAPPMAKRSAALSKAAQMIRRPPVTPGGGVRAPAGGVSAARNPAAPAPPPGGGPGGPGGGAPSAPPELRAYSPRTPMATAPSDADRSALEGTISAPVIPRQAIPPPGPQPPGKGLGIVGSPYPDAPEPPPQMSQGREVNAGGTSITGRGGNVQELGQAALRKLRGFGVNGAPGPTGLSGKPVPYGDDMIAKPIPGAGGPDDGIAKQIGRRLRGFGPAGGIEPPMEVDGAGLTDLMDRGAQLPPGLGDGGPEQLPGRGGAWNMRNRFGPAARDMLDR